MKKTRNFLSFFLLVLFAALVACTFIARELLTPLSNRPERIDVVIPSGDSAREIADRLHDKGVIRHAWSFRLLVRLTGTGAEIKTGTYALSPSLSPYQVLKKLVRGERVVARITIPEGFTLKQIAGLLGRNGVVGRDAFLSAARSAVFDPDGLKIKIRDLEGFLFPDTYLLPPNISPIQAYRPMLDRFEQLVVPLYEKSHVNRSIDFIITLASLVEREARLPKDRPIIAAVYYNRLKKGMPLQCDATIQYLLPRPRLILTDKDLAIQSPYNTYLHPGLPPGPIGSPGLASIMAALHPAHVPYLYYVADGNGGHVFSVTYSQHLRAVAHYRQWLSRHPSR